MLLADRAFGGQKIHVYKTGKLTVMRVWLVLRTSKAERVQVCHHTTKRSAVALMIRFVESAADDCFVMRDLESRLFRDASVVDVMVYHELA